MILIYLTNANLRDSFELAVEQREIVKSAYRKFEKESKLCNGAECGAALSRSGFSRMHAPHITISLTGYAVVSGFDVPRYTAQGSYKYPFDRVGAASSADILDLLRQEEAYFLRRMAHSDTIDSHKVTYSNIKQIGSAVLIDPVPIAPMLIREKETQTSWIAGYEFYDKYLKYL